MTDAPIVTVNVRNVAVGGEGVGEVLSQSDGQGDLLGITAFVPYSAIGEVVSARVVQRKDRYVKTQLVNIENTSPQRTEPECEYFMHCGGCELQHISYAGQLFAKEEMIRGALRAGRLPQAVLNCLREIHPSNPYHYRRRVTLHVDCSGKVGFYRAKSRAVVPIKSCAVADEPINAKLSDIQAFGAAIAGKAYSMIIESDPDGAVVILKSPYKLGKEERKNLLTAAKNYFTNVSLLEGEDETGGFGRKIVEVPLNKKGNLTLQVEAGDFSQVNSEINVSLVEYMIDLIKPKFKSLALDLYAGAGNFAVPLAKAGMKVTAVEVSPRLVRCGRQNSTRYGLEKHLDFIEGSVESYLATPNAKQEFDVIIADPPRSGLGSLVQVLPKANQLILISCHLPSFVRDLKGLLENEWEIENIKPFDMFAQTSYIEIVTCLSRRSS